VCFFSGDHNLNVTIGSNGTIAHLKHHLVEQGPAENPALQGITVARQRIIYMGKQLPDNLVRVSVSVSVLVVRLFR
jgi:hypothetical protein